MVVAVVALAVAWGVLVLRHSPPAGGPTVFPEAAEDYASARQKFKTRLTNWGPAPQAFADVHAPDDVDEVTFPAGGLTLRAWLTAEPEVIRVRKPAVLLLHAGFAFGQEDWGMAVPFEEAGFVVMMPLLRGENGQEGDYTLFYDEVDDVLAAAEYLATQPHADPDRLFVAGHGTGGTLAMLAAMAGGRFQGCASFSGPPDLPAWAADKKELVPFDPAADDEFRMRSPLAFPRSFRRPARLYYGTDETVLKSGSTRLAQLARLSKPDLVMAEEVPGDPAGVTAAAVPRAIEFFRGLATNKGVD